MHRSVLLPFLVALAAATACTEAPPTSTSEQPLAPPVTVACPGAGLGQTVTIDTWAQVPSHFSATSAVSKCMADLKNKMASRLSNETCSSVSGCPQGAACDRWVQSSPPIWWDTSVSPARWTGATHSTPVLVQKGAAWFVTCRWTGNIRTRCGCPVPPNQGPTMGPPDPPWKMACNGVNPVTGAVVAGLGTEGCTDCFLGVDAQGVIVEQVENCPQAAACVDGVVTPAAPGAPLQVVCETTD